jgi:hypothetical protein
MGGLWLPASNPIGSSIVVCAAMSRKRPIMDVREISFSRASLIIRSRVSHLSVLIFRRPFISHLDGQSQRNSQPSPRDRHPQAALIVANSPLPQGCFAAAQRMARHVGETLGEILEIVIDIFQRVACIDLCLG